MATRPYKPVIMRFVRSGREYFFSGGRGYLALDDLHDLRDGGEPFVVLDSTTFQDVTALTLR